MYSINNASSISPKWQAAVEDYLSPLATKSYDIDTLYDNNLIALYEKDRKVNFASTLLKVVSYSTLVLPLLALIARSIYRARYEISFNKIKVGPTHVFILGSMLDAARVNQVHKLFGSRAYVPHKICLEQLTLTDTKRIIAHHSALPQDQKPILAFMGGNNFHFSDRAAVQKMLSDQDLAAFDLGTYLVRDLSDNQPIQGHTKDSDPSHSVYCLKYNSTTRANHQLFLHTPTPTE